MAFTYTDGVFPKSCHTDMVGVGAPCPWWLFVEAPIAGSCSLGVARSRRPWVMGPLRLPSGTHLTLRKIVPFFESDREASDCFLRENR